MPFSMETAVASYLNGAQPSITAVASKPALACIRIVAPPQLPALTLVHSREDAPTAANDSQTLESLKTPADMAIGQLIRMAQFDDDWDGSGAAKPIVSTINDARAFIRALAPESVIPRATLHADGHAILFVREPDVYGEIEFLGNNKIGFYVSRGSDQWSDEITFDGKSLPEGLCQIGFAV